MPVPWILVTHFDQRVAGIRDEILIPILCDEHGVFDAHAAVAWNVDPGFDSHDHARLKDLSLQRPRQWGACSLACELDEQLGLDRF